MVAGYRMVTTLARIDEITAIVPPGRRNQYTLVAVINNDVFDIATGTHGAAE